ncbi:TetR/AcrR family transcriptional regulator [Maritimibacter sp. DP1N21-5]|uniref:TetR/AcrR family transcriptional regulator n=1 Tax=Maritimibacter sp. DP1N21-5 TaxID=2836867 RepID=UPI001C47871D|nr:TetR/AcrR family transcriptional regulator [Maritimibacter sp. DP1N21-5]MBV7408442.1 TetR/AcrR family transcriptional regulator [Maritimibacter sp. DP1N21-5]
MTGTRRTKSQQKILAAAEALFLSQGYVGTSMDAITETAGVSKQTVYAHFANKEALFLAMIDHLVGGATAAVRHRLPLPGPGDDLRDTLTDFARADLAVVLTPRLMGLRRLVIGEQARFPDLAASLFSNGPQGSIDRIRDILNVFAGRGELRPCDIDRAAEHFNWLVMGGPTSRAMLLGDGSFLPPDEQARHAADCADIFCAAYAAGHANP